MRIVTKQDDLNRIRTYGPTPEDMADDRPRVRRAALCHLATNGDEAERIRCLDIAAADKSDVVFLSVARATRRRRSVTQGHTAAEIVTAAIDVRVQKLLPAARFPPEVRYEAVVEYVDKILHDLA